MGTYLTWLADELRTAGLVVVEHDGWRVRGAAGRTYPNGGFTTPAPAVIWHHDASAPGDSPGVPAAMLARWDTAAAQLWVSRAGVWHILAAGVAWQTGAVLPGMPNNWTSIGVETDHTTGEDWPDALLDSLRLGTAVILRRLGRHPSTGLHFHKSICSPVGRKVDPDRLDLATERGRVATLMTGDTAMAITAAEIDAIAARTASKVWAQLVTGRAEAPAGVSAIQEVADSKTYARAAATGIDALPAKIVDAVVDAIEARYALTLTPKEPA